MWIQLLILGLIDGANGEVAPTPAQESQGGGGRGSKGRRRNQIAVVEYEGRDYRVPLENLDSFLEAIKKKAENPAPVKVAKKKAKVSPEVPPRLVIKSAPAEFMFEFKQFVDKSNEILQKIWQGMISRALADMDDEEALLLLL